MSRNAPSNAPTRGAALASPPTAAELAEAIVSRDLAHQQPCVNDRGRLCAEFSSAVANELRTPLTSLNAALALLAARPDMAGSAESLVLIGIARRSTDRLMRLVQDSLDLAEAEAGTLRLAVDRIAPRHLLHMVCGHAERLARQRAATLVIELHTHRWVRGDAGRVERVVAHLVDNALAFAPAGSAVTVSVTDAVHDELRIAVEDHGPGISPDRLERVFEQFRQFDAPGRRRAGGVGIGLALSRAVIEAHGGRITVDSTPGRTVVTCFLPALDPPGGGADL